MNTTTLQPADSAAYPVNVRLAAQTENRNRLTTGFRILLAIPHLLLVGGPLAAVLSWTWSSEPGGAPEWGTGGGVLGAVAAVAALIAWFAILFTGRHPEGLWNLGSFYLRWRVRAVAYMALLRDEYPPFGEGEYPAALELALPPIQRDRLTVGLRLILAIPHILAVWALGVAWGIVAVVAWLAILFTGHYPPSLYEFSVGVFQWSVRVEAYLLLLTDEYPPFSLR